MLSRLGRLVTARPGWVIAVVLLVTAALAPFISRLRIEANLTRILPVDDPGRKTTSIVDREFGGSDIVAVIVEAGDIFQPVTLYALDTLAAQFAALPGVNGVQSLTTLQDVKGVGDDVVVSRIIDSVPADSAGVAALREQVLSDSRYRGVLVSEDGSSALLLVRVSPEADQEKVVRDIDRVIDGSPLKPGISLTGPPAQMKYVRDWMVADLLVLLPLVVLVLVLVLSVIFRSWYGVLLPLGAVLIALIWTMGLVGLFGQPLTLALVVLPTVLVSVGSAYGIHIVERWRAERSQGRDSRAAAGAAVGNTGLPVFLAMATTAAGFASNVFMRIAPIRAFAIFASVGVILSFILALTFVPAVLCLGVKGRSAGSGQEKHTGRRSRLLAAWGGWVSRHRWPVLAAAALLTLACLVMARRVHPETDFTSYFKPGSMPARAARTVSERFGGGQQFEFVLEGDIQDPAVLARMERFEQGLKQVPHITQTFSIVGVLRATNKAFNGGRPEFDRLPETREAIAQYLLLLSFSGSDFLADFLTTDSRLARITAKFDRQESREIGLAMVRINKLMGECFESGDGPAVTASVGGMPMALYALHQSIQQNQLWSIIIALVAVFLLVAVLFRSVPLGLAAMLPMVFTLSLAFGVMGLLGIQVDLVTAMLGAIAVGIGIDYSCHLIARHREEARAGAEGEELIRRTLGAVGPPILANALAVGLGFAVLAFASLVIIQRFGILIAVTMLFSSIGALVLLPAVLSRRPKERRTQ